MIIFQAYTKEQMPPLNGQHYLSCVDCLQMARIHAALWNRLSNRSAPSAAKSGKRPVAQMALLPRHGAVGVWNTGVSRPESASQPVAQPGDAFLFSI